MLSLKGLGVVCLTEIVYLFFNVRSKREVVNGFN